MTFFVSCSHYSFFLLLYCGCLKPDRFLTHLRDKRWSVPPPAAYLDSSKPNIQMKCLLLKMMSVATLLLSKSGKNSTALPDLNSRVHASLRTVTVFPPSRVSPAQRSRLGYPKRNLLQSLTAP